MPPEKIKVNRTTYLSKSEIEVEIELLQKSIFFLSKNATLSYLSSRDIMEELTSEKERLERLIY